MVSLGKQTNSVCASGEGEELGRVRKRGERRRCREGGREVRGERGRWRGKERLEQDGGLLQVQRILLFDFSLKPVHLVHVYTLMVACRVCEQERERERDTCHHQGHAQTHVNTQHEIQCVYIYNQRGYICTHDSDHVTKVTTLVGLVTLHTLILVTSTS